MDDLKSKVTTNAMRGGQLLDVKARSAPAPKAVLVIVEKESLKKILVQYHCNACKLCAIIEFFKTSMKDWRIENLAPIASSEERG